MRNLRFSQRRILDDLWVLRRTVQPWKFRPGHRSKLRKVFSQPINFQNATLCCDTPEIWCNLESKFPRTPVFFFFTLQPMRGVLTCKVCAGSRIICDCCKFSSVAVSWLEHVWYGVMLSIRAVSHCAQPVTRSVIFATCSTGGAAQIFWRSSLTLTWVKLGHCVRSWYS